MHLLQSWSEMFHWRLSTCRQTCLASCCAVQLLSEIIVDAQSPADNLETKGPNFRTLVLVTSSILTACQCILGYNTVQRITMNTTQIQRARSRKETIRKEERTSRR